MLQPNFSNFPEIQTNRLLLRRITHKDALQIFRLRSDERVMQFIDKERAASIEDAEVFINRIIQLLNINDGITWAIALNNKPETLIGTIGCWRLIKEHYRAEIGYMLQPEFWQQGIMKEALNAVINYSFNELKLHSIEAQINPENTASAAILTSAGFIKEGYFKENFFFNGKFGDTAVYSKLQSNIE
jgi:ribosomal-protein-alanine N-acetyltransferase